MRYVLIFTLGPVQSFIAEARRTQDLYAGSRILAGLSRAAAREASGDLIYPAHVALVDPDAGVPNKFVAIVEDPKEAVQRAWEAANKQWVNFSDAALKKLLDPNDNVLRNIWKRQLDHYLEFYWAAASLDIGYKRAYQQASEALDARKRTRNFEQVEEDGFKDSLSGKRSALRTSDKDSSYYWSEMLKAQRAQSDLKEAERLDAIGSIKRFSLDKKFPSVSTVASAPFAKACSDKGLLSDLIQAIETFNQERRYFFYEVDDWGRGFKYDGDLLYKETYSEIRLKSSYGLTNYPTEVVAKLKGLYEKTKEGKIKPTRPSPYYAILAMDGDQMGKHIAACCTKDEHTELSRKLAVFSKEAKDLTEKCGGYLVYAGGDDVLAFFPLESALKGADVMARAYQQQFADWQQHAPDGRSLPFTISAGIAIAHHLHPLGAVLEEVRAAEKRSKNLYKRNAVCISVLKRSGEPLHVGSQWEVNGISIVNLVHTAIDDFRQSLASRFAYELYDQLRALGIIETSMLSLLLKRLLKRHWSQDGIQPKTTSEDLVAWIKAFEQNGIIIPDGAAAELCRWLLLARFIEQGGGE